MEGWSFDLLSIQPLIEIFRVENHRHSVMHGLGDGIRIGCDDRKALKPDALGRLPRVPQTSHAHCLISRSEAECLLVRLAPLIVTVHWNDAAVPVKRTAPKELCSKPSARALKVVRFWLMPFEPKPTKPQRIGTSSRLNVSRSWRSTGWVVVGAML